MPTNPLDSTRLSATARLAEGTGERVDRVFRSACFAPTEDGVEHLRADPLTGEWEALVDRMGALPFLRPQWLIAWWRAFAWPDEQLQLWYLRRDGRLAALVPMVREGNNLRLAMNYHTPQSGLLAEDDAAAETLLRALLQDSAANEMLFAGLDSLSHDPDLCMRAARSTGHNTLVVPHECSWFLSLKEGWAAYEARLGREVHRDVSRDRRHLQEYGRVVVDISDGHMNLSGLLDTALAVEAAGWKRRSGTAIVSSPRIERFYRDIARWAMTEDMLRLCFLRADGKPLAMQIALEHHGVWHLLKSGYDDKYAAASPGRLLLHDCIRHCFAAGMGRVEFHGDNEVHKLNWQPQCRLQQRVHLFPDSLPGRLAWARTALGPWLRSLAARLNLLPTDSTPAA